MTNYSAFSVEELCSLAITDVNARAWIADHAEDLLVNAHDRAEFELGYQIEEASEEAYGNGNSDGRDAELENLRNIAGESIIEALAGKLDNKWKLRELLKQIADEINLDLEVAEGSH